MLSVDNCAIDFNVPNAQLFAAPVYHLQPSHIDPTGALLSVWLILVRGVLRKYLLNSSV